MSGDPRLYSDFASWWPLLSPPSHYVEEAADLLPLLLSGSDTGRKGTLLELGCGGGSLAHHLKEYFALTLTDLSPAMLAVSQRLNSECEHVCGDMRSLDLGRWFDRVLIHDAIMYATDPDAVRATLRVAAAHCKPGGLVIVVPDCVRETFTPGTESGGEDDMDGRALRYLQWTWDPDPEDYTYELVFAFLMREADGRIAILKDCHRHGCFPRADWLKWFDEAGFDARIHHDPWNRDVFVGVRRDSSHVAAQKPG